MRKVIAAHPTIQCSIGNPTAALRLHPALVAATSGDNPLFRLAEVDYCKTATPEFDGGLVFTQKPTDMWLYGVPAAEVFSLPRCNHDCSFRFLDHTGHSHLHLQAIHIDHWSPLGQAWQIGLMRHAIPHTLFHILFEAHKDWLTDHEAV